MVGLTKVHLVPDHEALVAGAFHVALVEPALVSVGAPTALVLVAIIDVALRALAELVPSVDVLAAGGLQVRRLTIAAAGDRGDRATRVDDQRLALAV